MRGRAGLAARAVLIALALAAVFAPSAAAAGAAPIFQAQQEFATPQQPMSVAVGDLNGDGRPDLVTANFFDGLSVLLGNGDGTFQAKRDYATGSGLYSVAVGDLNGDGRPDLVAVGTDEFAPVDELIVLLGNGDGTFQAKVAYPAGPVGPYSVAIADLNGDGEPDLVTANRDGDSVSVWLGNGDGTLQACHDYLIGAAQFSVAVGDLNGDGRPDIVTTNAGAVAVLLGNGDGTFQAAHDYAAGGAGSVAIGDVNGDGWPDIVTTNYGSQTVSVLLGNGDGTFQANHDYATGGPNPLSVAVGDVNGDGEPDLVIANQDFFSTPFIANGDGVSVLLGNGDGTFQAPHDFATGQRPDSAAIADLNGDGRPDLVIANGDYFGGSVSVLLATTTLDTSSPSVRPDIVPSWPPPSASGWYSSPATVYWNWIDNGDSSGMDSAHCPKTSTVSTDGVFSLAVTCKDVAGNTGSASMAVKFDETPPTLAPTLAQSVFPFEGKTTVAANPHASDALSGLASVSCEKVDTSWPGTWALKCTATDNAGNTSTGTVRYIVARPLKPGRTTTCSVRNGATAYYSGTGGNFRVPSGAVCVLLSGAHVKGRVVVDTGGTLTVSGAQIDGNLDVAGSATVCGSRIGHPVFANGGSLTLGGPTCAGNKVAGLVTVSNDTGNVWVWGNTIRGGGLTVTHATGATTSIVGNTVSGALLVVRSGPSVEVSANRAKTASCVKNAGQTGSGNVTHGKNTCPH
jgi:hypothetical protein